MTTVNQSLLRVDWLTSLTFGLSIEKQTCGNTFSFPELGFGCREVVARCVSQIREWFSGFTVVVAVAVKLTECQFEGGRDASCSLLRVWRCHSDHNFSHDVGGADVDAMEAQQRLDDSAEVTGSSSWSATVATT